MNKLRKQVLEILAFLMIIFIFVSGIALIICSTGLIWEWDTEYSRRLLLKAVLTCIVILIVTPYMYNIFKEE